MIDNLKTKWQLLSPKHKTGLMWLGGFLVIIFLVFVLSDAPLKRVQTVFSESERGVFEVNDRAVTLEALGTQMNAQKSQNALLKDQLKALNAQMVKSREIINSLSGSDQNVRTLNEVTKKIQSMESKLENIANKQDYFSGNELSGFDPLALELEQEGQEGQDEVSTAVVSKSRPERLINDTPSKQDIPDDPLAFIRSVSSASQSDDSAQNIFVNTGQDTPVNIRPPGKIEIVSNEQVTDNTIESGSEFQYEGARLLAGSLIPAIVVSGVDAPTGKAAEKGSISSTLRITGPAILPNGYRVDLTGCLVTADVRGDTATERAYFRPNRITCQYEFGDVDVPIQGYITGKDGVQGLRGRVVSKQGTALMYGAFSGAIGGIGQAFGGGRQNQNLVGISGTGYELPDSQQVAQSVASGAVSESADFLSEYYKDKLNELYEIIEIKPLVTTSIHVMKTFELELLDKAVRKVKK